MWWLSAIAGAGDVVVVVGATAGEAPTEVAVAIDEPADELEDEDADRPHGKRELAAGTGIEFLDTSLAQTFDGRIEGGRDGYVEIAARLHPSCWSGRVGAGLDVFGDGPLDLTFGLFLGARGETVEVRDRVALATAPIAGGQAAIGIDGRHLFTRYTWLAGWGGGRTDAALTENQFVLGFKVARIAEIYGEYVVLSPGSAPLDTGIGLGARIVL
jgi:hypothetical protein